MFLSENKENGAELQTHKHDLNLQELMIRIDHLDREVKTLMDELQVSPHQVSQFVSQSSNFTSENWEELQKQRRMLDEKLTRELENIRNPSKVKKTFQERKNVERHWIFVR